MQHELKWQPASKINQTGLSAELCQWILHPGSFMQRLEQHGAIQPRVQVLSEQWQLPTEDEKTTLQLAEGLETLVRQVLIKSEGRTWMYARTIFPHDIIEIEPQLEHLENRSLGSVLFKDPTMRRTEFEVTAIHSDTACYQTISHIIPLQVNPVWARRSKFYLHEKPLLLTEVFLPDIETL